MRARITHAGARLRVPGRRIESPGGDASGALGQAVVVNHGGWIVEAQGTFVGTNGPDPSENNFT